MSDSRDLIHAAIEEACPFNDCDGGDDVPDSGVVTGWVLVAEWQGTDGNRWLSKVSGDASGSRALPQWTERGLCYEVANNWDSEEG